MTKGKIVWLVIAGVFVILQFIPSGRPESSDNNPGDLLKNNEVPVPVSNMLRAACYDCHSNETHYPWYAYVAPVSWLVSRDVRLGRGDLNLSDWEQFSKEDQLKLLDEMGEEVADGNMPMVIYPLTHPEAKLSPSDREDFVAWTEDFGESILRKRSE